MLRILKVLCGFRFDKGGLVRKKHIMNLFFSHLNINSLRDKKEFLEALIRNHFDILLVS